MKSMDTWFKEYSADHQHPINQKIHLICVPLIVYSVLGLLWSLPALILGEWIVNWSWLFATGALLFYLALDLKLATVMAAVVAVSFYSFTFLMAKGFSVITLSAVIFIGAWIGQFYGHKLEGQKPSFLTDMTYLFIGPLWVANKLLGQSRANTPF